MFRAVIDKRKKKYVEHLYKEDLCESSLRNRQPSDPDYVYVTWVSVRR